MMLRPPHALAIGLACVLYTACAPAGAVDAGRDAAVARIGQFRDQAQWLDALAAIQDLQARYPGDDFLYRLQVLTLSDIGNAYRAWQLYKARPELFDEGQRARLEANALAKRVNWSLAYGESEDTRLDEASDTLADMDGQLARDGLTLAQAPLRTRYDRLILLNRLSRHDEVRADYLALTAEGHPLPDYVLAAVGDSLLATQHPEEAIPVLQAAIKGDPSRTQAHSQLGYAYLENEQARTAIGSLEAWQKDEPVWRWGANPRALYANDARYEADINLAMIRAYSGDLEGAQGSLEERVGYGPGNGGLQSALGSVYQMRGWPRRALERQRMAYTIDPRDVSARIGMYEAYVALQRDDLARPIHDDLLQHYPGQPSVMRMDRDWRAHRGWQFQATAEGGRSSGGGGTSPLGNDDARYGMEVQSPVLDDRWRLVAAADRRTVTFQDQRIDPLWLAVGTRYRMGNLDADVFARRATDGVGGTGVSAALGWQFNDHWHAGISAARNDPDASMQARVSGITADSMAIAADYRPSELTHWSIGVSRFRYDDGNRRDTVSSTLEQRLLTWPTLTIDGLGGLYASRGSRDDAPYFNPSEDRSVEIGVRLDQQVWRRYERHFRHRLAVSVGDYWQQDHGSALVPSVEYRHEWQMGQGRILEYGVRWSRPVYDGQRERHLGLDVGLHWGE